MKLYKALFVSIFIIVATITALRYYGETQIHKNRQHPALDNIANKTTSENRDYWSKNNVLPYIKVSVQDGKLQFHANQEVISINPQDLNKPMIIELTSNDQQMNYLLNQWVLNNQVSDSIIVYSQYKNVIQNIRNVAPRWLTSLSLSEINKCILLHKMWLASLCEIDSSFAIILTQNYQSHLNDLPWYEFKKRKLWIISDDKKILNHYPYTIFKF